MSKKGYKLKLPDLEELKGHSELLGKMEQPDHVIKASHFHHHQMSGLSSLRRFEHNGHKVEIETTYRITIDGNVYEGHASVDGEGHIQCHAIPYKSWSSAVEFVKHLLDQYPQSFVDEK